MSSKPRTGDAVRDDIIAAIAELRAVAQSQQDEQRAHSADWLDALFDGVTDRRGLREASAEGLRLYRGGMGSFQDVGNAPIARVVGELNTALRRGRSYLLRNS